MRSFITYMSLAILALLGFTATAAAASQVTPDEGSLLDLAKPVFDAVMHGQYWIGASLALVFACAAARRYGAKRWPALHEGGIPALGLLFGMSFGGALATGLAAVGTNAISMALVLTSAKVALAAAGGFSVFNHLGEWLMSRPWFESKVPAWAKPIIKLALWAFTKPSTSAPDPKVVRDAEVAGDKAVEVKPSTGVEGVIGKPEEL